MKYNHVHDLLDQEDIQNTRDDLYSYSEMRDELVKVIVKSRGRKRLHLEQILDILDLTAEITLRASNQEEIEAEIYSILS